MKVRRRHSLSVEHTCSRRRHPLRHILIVMRVCCDPLSVTGQVDCLDKVVSGVITSALSRHIPLQSSYVIFVQMLSHK